jgi:tRNA(Ile)-lysidine synthetase-like protein
LPQLELINPNCVAAINSLSDCARYDCNYFDKFVQHVDDSTLNYKKADDSIKYRYIKHILVQNDLDYDKNKIELIKHFIDDNLNSKSGKTFTLSSELNLFVNASKIIVVKSKQEPIYDVMRITTEGIYEFNDKIFSITKAEIIPERFPQDSENYAFVELDNINFTLRTRRDGDIISPIGLNGHQKLKKYLNEKKIPSYIKDSLILLCNDNEVFWVAGVGLSDKIKVRNNVTHVLRISEK